MFFRKLNSDDYSNEYFNLLSQLTEVNPDKITRDMFSKFIDNASIKKGICSQYKDFPDKLDEECGKLDKNVCGSVNCCTLLGGSKCVAGNNQGPISKLHYGNQMIKNRDFYYYKGLCYGNCVKTKTEQ